MIWGDTEAIYRERMKDISESVDWYSVIIRYMDVEIDSAGKTEFLPSGKKEGSRWVGFFELRAMIPS